MESAWGIFLHYCFNSLKVFFNEHSVELAKGIVTVTMIVQKVSFAGQTTAILESNATLMRLIVAPIFVSGAENVALKKLNEAPW